MVNLVKQLFALLVLVCSAGMVAGHAQDLSSFFKDTEGAIVLYDLKNNRYIRYNEERCRRRFSPFSTFKIPNSLIGLETGVIEDAEFLIRWDQKKYPPQEQRIAPFTSWNQDHTLRSAMKNSVVWYYRELAERVGKPVMQQYVTKLRYGNHDTSGGINRFWLGSSLQISPNEQVEFLRRFYKEELPVSARSIQIVKEIISLEQTPAYKLSGKTGSGSLPGGKALGWFIGYVERSDNVYFFATNIEGANYSAVRDKRIALTKRILLELGWLPKAS
ncbi:MAG: class D beta-lactamase [Pyrinomonadaceae bacterium]|nr:class D beta-lactamase [Pyrinomonadaceae bacterium]